MGGDRAVKACVEIFNEKVVTDPRLKMFFGDADITLLKGHQTMFLHAAVGGPGRSLTSLISPLFPLLFFLYLVSYRLSHLSSLTSRRLHRETFG